MAATTTEEFWNPYTERVENKWAASEYGLMVSRQNGKGSILEARELAGLFIFGERLIIHSAHQADTSFEAFNRIMQLIEQTPDLEREVARVSRSHGTEGIELKSGQRLRFRTRTKGGGRGFTADCIIFDEAMLELTSTQIAAIMPTVSARPNPQMIYTGSAGTKEAEHFGRVRARALKGGDPHMGWSEWSITPCNYFCPIDCDEHDSPDDPASHAKANPAMGIRITAEHIMKERRAMSLETFLQERCGVGDWPSDGDGWSVIDRDAWEGRENQLSSLVGKFAIAIDTAPKASYSCISAVGLNEFGDFHCEITKEGDENGEGLFDYRQGIRWVVPRVLAIWKANRPAFVVIDKASPAGTLIEELESHGVKVVSPTIREFAQACGDVKDGFAPRDPRNATHIHLNQAPLNLAVANAEMLPLQDLWRFSKSASSADVTPLTCVTLAHWGFKQHIYKKASKPWVIRR